jgi:molecular chaperone GrpE
MHAESTTERPDGSAPDVDTERSATEPREDGGTASGGGSSASTALQEDPDNVRRERDDYRDRLLRTTAEFDNYRKRVERERRELSEYAAADLLKDVLPLVDDLERALAATPAADTAAAVAGYRAGVELILRQVLELLRKRGVTPIEALGADFDPHVHQAVSQEPSASHRDGEVIQELRRGYKLGDRLLRPAMVKVAASE